MINIKSEYELIALTLALIDSASELSAEERFLIKGVRPTESESLIDEVRKLTQAGNDPLGQAFSEIRPSKLRRDKGATYTPEPIISSMTTWAAGEDIPDRVVDAGAGSGRFLLAAAQHFPNAELIGIEFDPLAALMLRANLSILGLNYRAKVLVSDYRKVKLSKITGKTLFIGNPPYVRHHLINEEDKKWFANTAASFGVKASKLAGLHIHFFVRTMELAKLGDFGVFITSAEWLDVNYGATLRQLLVDGLGGVALHVLEPSVMPFSDATTTGAITCFKIGETAEKFRVRAVESLEDLNGLSTGKLVSWDTVSNSKRWSNIIKPGPAIPPGYIELGEICRVHRGQVTGSNGVWIAGEHAKELPENFLTPTITKARDLISAGDTLSDYQKLRRVIDLPTELDQLRDEELSSVEKFLSWAKKQGADQSYIARHRRAWWSVGLKEPAPILCTYMARRAPAFVRNLCGARHINIAHGLYPKEKMDDITLDRLAAWLRNNVGVESGRTYAGGLTKFEPKEIERIWVPRPDELEV